jgi:hypothetical protein
MPLPGTIESAPDGALGFDANTPVSLTVAQQFAEQGYSFCLRYLSRATTQGSNDLSAAEANNILAAGLGLMAVQHPRKDGWIPTQALGTSDGANAAGNAASIGFPPGVNIWCDLEGLTTNPPAQDVIDYCTAWFNAAAATGYVPGLYVGANCVLSGQQLYDLPFQHYWKSGSNVPTLPARGYQMFQSSSEFTLNGIQIDKNTTQTDGQGGQAQWLVDTTP